MAVSAVGLAVAAGAAPALAKRPTPKLVGNPAAGKPLFVANCGTCHTLKAAGSVGTIGPNLDKLAPKLSEATIIKQIRQGGSALMGKAAAKYTTQMVGYAGVLSTAQIDDIAAFVYTSTHK